MGMASNAEGAYKIDDLGNDVLDSNQYKNSSYLEGHTERAQAAAPRFITLENLKIVGHGRNPVYFVAGVTYQSY